MAERERIPRDALIVSDERVNCPIRRGDSEVETCWRCRWLSHLGASDDVRYVVCAPPFGSLPPVGTWPLDRARETA